MFHATMMQNMHLDTKKESIAVDFADNNAEKAAFQIVIAFISYYEI